MLRRLHTDTRAQVSFLGLVGAFALIGMLAMIMNTGDVLRHRMACSQPPTLQQYRQPRGRPVA